MGWRTAVAVLSFPLVLGGSMLGLVGLLRNGANEVLSVMGVTLGAALVLLVLQAVQPYRRDWNRWVRHAPTDLAHTLLSNGLVNALFKALTFGGLFAGAVELSRWVGMSLWPHDLPVVAQVVLGMVLGEFYFYWAHRLAHRFPSWWRFHAVHHSSEQLHVLSAGRNHPVNAWVSFMSQTLPAIVLGASPEVIGLLSVFTSVHGMLQHANVDLRLGPLNHVFATAPLHRWHHSAEAAEGHTNYGSNLVIWDHIFGSFHLPDAGPEEVGITDRRVPQGFWAHMLVPFAWNRVTQPPEPPVSR